jgi:hypothetical protein
MTGPNGPLKAWEMYDSPAHSEYPDIRIITFAKARETGTIRYETTPIVRSPNEKPDETKD